MLKVALAFLILFAGHALAESNLTGTVREPSGAPIDAARVAVFDIERKGFQTVTAGGSFAFKALPEGEYFLSVESDGRRPVLGALRVIDGASQEINIVMVNGASKAAAAVAAAAPLRGAIRPPQSSKRPKVKPANVIQKVNPAFPTAERRSGMAAVVRLSMIILPNGTVDDLVVLAAPNRNFAIAALLAVRHWLYSPTYLDGEPVEAGLTVEVNFQP